MHNNKIRKNYMKIQIHNSVNKIGSSSPEYTPLESAVERSLN